MREKLPDLSELLRDTLRPSTNILFEQEGLWQAPVCSSSSVARRVEGFSQDVLNSKHGAKVETTPCLRRHVQIFKDRFLPGTSHG